MRSYNIEDILYAADLTSFHAVFISLSSCFALLVNLVSFILVSFEKEETAFDDDLNAVGFIASDDDDDNDDDNNDIGDEIVDNNDKDPNGEIRSNTDDYMHDVMDRDDGIYNSDGTNDDVN